MVPSFAGIEVSRVLSLHVTAEVKTNLMTYTRLSRPHRRPDIDQPYGCGALKRDELRMCLSRRLITALHSLTHEIELFLRL